MKKYILLFLSFLVLLLFRCKKEEVVNVHLTYQETIKIPLISNGLRFVPNWELFHKGGKLLLGYHHIYDSQLEIYDFKKREFYKRVKLDQEGPNMVDASRFKFQEDNIIALGTNMVYILDYDGQVLDKISLLDEDMEKGLQPIESYSLRPNSNMHGADDFIAADNKSDVIYLPIRRTDKSVAETDFFEVESIIASISLKEKQMSTLNIPFPEAVFPYRIFGGNLLWSDYIYPYLCPDESGYLTYSFPSTSWVYKYSIQKDQIIIKNKIGSDFTADALQTVSGDVESYKFIEQIFMRETIFGPVKFDPNAQLYYRIHKAPIPMDQDEKSRKKYFTIFNKDLEKRGEIIFPNHLSDLKYSFTDDGPLFLSSKNPSEDSVYFEQYKIQPIKK